MRDPQPKTITLVIVLTVLLAAFVVGPFAYAIWGPPPEYERHGQEPSAIR